MESASADLPLAVAPAIIRISGMDFVITLIADPLSAKEADTMLQLLSMQGIAARQEWVKTGNACDIFVSYNDAVRLDAIVRDALRSQPIDAVIQPVANRRKKLLIADMESTIITCECLDELAEYVGLKEKIAAITARAMNGELNFEEAITERVGLLAELPESALLEVYNTKATLMPGAAELVRIMRDSGAYCMLVSGGFDFYTSRIAEKLGFHEHRANRLEIKDGKLTGRIIPPILGKEAKLEALKETCAKLGISTQDAVAVGDGANDLPMLMEAGLGIAYHAKPVVRAQAKARINNSDLRALLWAQGITA